MSVNQDEREPLLQDDGGDGAAFARRKQFLDRTTKLGIILVLLIWGTILLLKNIPKLTNDGNNDKKNQPPHRKFKLPNPNVTEDGLSKILYENIKNETFKPVFHSLQWISNSDDSNSHDDKGLYVATINDSYVIKSVFDKDYSQTLLENKQFSYSGENLTVDYFSASPDLKYLLIRTNSKKNWRHSSFGTFFIYDKDAEEEKKFHKLGDNIALAQWSPNSIDIAYVQNNNIYLYSVAECKITATITDDGNSRIFNGKPDWVYEEEVLETDRALWWSPKGDYLAFFKTDETKVEEFTIPYYVQNPDDIYPEMRPIKYPKSGTPNPTVDLWIYNLVDQSSHPTDVNLQHMHAESPVLITEVKWINNESLIAKISDRSSDILKVLLIDADLKKTEMVRENPSEGGWWEITHNTMPIPKDSSHNRSEHGYIDIFPINGFNHLVYYSPATSNEPIVLTNGSWEVVSGPLAFDAELNRVYFIATIESSSTQRHLFYVELNNPQEIIQVSDVKNGGVYSASFSSGSKFALLTYRGPRLPYQKIIDLRSKERDQEIEGNVIGETLYYLEKNEKLQEILSEYDIPQKKVKLLNLGKDDDGDNIIANAFEILPNGFNPDLQDYYPVFFYAYGGPNSQQVQESFSVGFNEVVASQLGAIVVVVDGRGTGFKGKKFRSLVRDNLGEFEAIDQIAAAKQYSAKSYVNSEKISLFGWSYGGYLTLKVLERDGGETFKYGMAVAPVTDWRLYDTVYTERYMHTPQENIEGYIKSSVHDVLPFKEVKRFLVMHGTGDDNVHFQNTLKFLDLLTVNEVRNFDVHVFADSDHAIKYHNANAAVFTRLLNWAADAFTGRFEYDNERR
ncbi:dipeptidyl aminopeptidase NDAI_0C02510 [Naumovozyma dairenensis CBS 421]|uniref:Dipeptidyl aminopeptidase B n=1 Tax=Naumovozyma dairenensis (strain ATCC 10597 / BCRC 20456 / CBS 421 / NBRC 0211 / NRRL Y-12639) TaxID=1071378 RepID=G0W800_NAUDC|nr:hypothetical protein NDAI_0C02510 [Naumovozyma dairenensis CBS 421]CCD23911.1 hypothetical protein NDAI_0C02510 [Naumovozyma dairenensis CBS 421]